MESIRDGICRMKSKYSQLAIQISPAILFVTLWQLLILASPSYEFVMGSPIGILKEFFELLKAGTLLRDFFITTLEALLGFISGTVLGTATGLALWLSAKVYEVARPYIVALGSVPVFALGPVLIFWFGTGILSKVVLGFLATFIIAVVQAHTGACEADSNLLKLIKAFGGTRVQTFKKIIVPSATIWVLAGIRINISMALLGAFIGEFISSNMGLGNLIIVAEGLYNVNQIWVGVFCIILIALSFNWAVTPIEKWANRWR
jgi:NitT/TauT family transport system permease protein